MSEKNVFEGADEYTTPAEITEDHDTDTPEATPVASAIASAIFTNNFGC